MELFINSKAGSLWCFEKPANKHSKRSFTEKEIVSFDEIMACRHPDNLKNIFQNTFNIEKEIFIIDISKPVLSLGKAIYQKGSGELYKKAIAVTENEEVKICWIHIDDCVGLREVERRK